MRALIVSNIVSLDGYCAGPDGSPLWLPMDIAFDGYNRERLEAASTLLVGAETFRGLLGYWPAQADDPAAPDVEREIGRLNNAIEKVVVSDRLTAADTGVWTGTTRIVRRAAAHHVVGELKQADGGDILVFGSPVLHQHLLAAGLVDEVHLLVGALALGGGTPFFGEPVGSGTPFHPAPDRGLRLLDVRRFDGSDNVLLRYAVT
jgi:dihydrofolate reductase